jgi:hypothetical protein
MPHVGDVAVADRGVPTGATGSHVGFVTDVDFKNGTFTLESGNSSNIYTTRKISCFSFHTPPNNALSALTGTAIGNALTGLPLSRASIRVQFVPAISSSDPDDCSQGSLDTDNYDEIQNDSLHHVQAPATSFDFERTCVLHSIPSVAPRFCPYPGMFHARFNCVLTKARSITDATARPYRKITLVPATTSSRSRAARRPL